MWQCQINFFWWNDIVCNAFCFHKPYNRVAHIKPYTQSNILLRTAINCSLYTTSSFAQGGPQTNYPGLWQPPTPMHFLNRSTGGHRSDIFNNRDDLIYACTFHACFKVITLAPSRVCFSITTTYYPRVLSCICVFLVTAMHA